MEEMDDFKLQLFCPPCNRSFNGNMHFIVHLKEKHLTPDGYYQCTHCQKPFKTRNTINRHLKESSCYKLASRPYRCKLCAKNFKRNNHLNQHILRVHEEATLITDGNVKLIGKRMN